ncbi:MAG: Sir2 family NAD-dependent protein deacetylase [Planctomycetes bacterium]|nr:Sir2 family NAD-dependent protein deacetylase [Planctomycetota bacterium]
MFYDALSPAECAEKLRKARLIAVLTGAGMSTAAGVPDFRGPDGMYVTRRYDPETVFDIGYFDLHPEPFYQFSRDFLVLMQGVKPTFTHRLLAGLEQAGYNIAIVTQNIDGLHRRAGSKKVYPMHGDYETAACRSCGKKFDRAWLEEAMNSSKVPRCTGCGGVVKPDVVFFGENVRHMDRAVDLARRADVLMVLGSSLTVYPAAALPGLCRGEVIVVNRGSVGITPGANMFLADCDLDEFFREVAAALPDVIVLD